MYPHRKYPPYSSMVSRGRVSTARWWSPKVRYFPIFPSFPIIPIPTVGSTCSAKKRNASRWGSSRTGSASTSLKVLFFVLCLWWFFTVETNLSMEVDACQSMILVLDPVMTVSDIHAFCTPRNAVAVREQKTISMDWCLGQDQLMQWLFPSQALLPLCFMLPRRRPVPGR